MASQVKAVSELKKKKEILDSMKNGRKQHKFTFALVLVFDLLKYNGCRQSCVLDLAAKVHEMYFWLGD